MHPHLSLPIGRIHRLVACTTIIENLTFTESLDAISSSVDVNRFQRFVDAINGASLDITDANIAGVCQASRPNSDLSQQTKAHDRRFSVARSATWDCEDVQKLTAKLLDAIPPWK
jgi:hypothetical protein